MPSTTTRDKSRLKPAAKTKSRTTRTPTKNLRPPDSERVALRAWLDAMTIQKVWEHFKKEPSDGLRNYLAEKYLHLVRYNAERIYTRLPDEVEIDDLLSVGQFGLMEAINAFDLTRGVKFETFCAPRIRGAILDELRSMDWVPRLVRQRSGKINQIRMNIEMTTGRTPTEGEITARLGTTDEETKKILRDGSAVNITSLNRRCFQSDGSREVREIDIVEDERQINPLGEIQRRDLKDLMTKGLSRAERLIVILYYYEEMTMKEIGATLDLSESRVSQMHSSILARLKAQLQHRSREFEPVK
ncbi:MAG TPA: FliA/WhiG family RNA polymerase sigma factor [Phycisphaerales bacterium]|nr:FliA/WhiG family RNA polymerase sigma factor [Phycisphaerales bacterium]